MVYVPEYPFAIAVKRACGDHARYMRSTQPDPFIPALGDLRIGINAQDVGARNRQAASQRPQFVPTFHFENQVAVGEADFGHRPLKTQPLPPVVARTFLKPQPRGAVHSSIKTDRRCLSPCPGLPDESTR